MDVGMWGCADVRMWANVQRSMVVVVLTLDDCHMYVLKGEEEREKITRCVTWWVCGFDPHTKMTRLSNLQLTITPPKMIFERR